MSIKTKENTSKKYLKLEKAHRNNIAISDMNLKDKFTDFETAKLDESNTLLYEVNNDIKKYKRYKRGQIVKVKFGVNIGSEFSGTHFAIVVSKRDTMMNPILHVIPLTSKEHSYNIKLNNVLYNKSEIIELEKKLAEENNLKEKREIRACLKYYTERKNLTSYACIKHMRTISKLLICKPMNKYDYINNLKVSREDMKRIDNEIVSEYTIKNTN